MPVWSVRGGRQLSGSVEVQGAKNAVLPIMAASLVGGGVTCLRGCPALRDVDAAVDILRHLGCAVDRGEAGEIRIDARGVTGNHIPHSLMGRMRSSVMFLGAILARTGEARLSAPGGCELGARPIDLHLKALEELGIEVSAQGAEVVCRGRLRGGHVNLDFPSVGATENLMMAACASSGETVVTNAAREPEIVDLQRYLNAAGAHIRGAGSAEIHILGFAPREQVEHTVMPDRIAAATWLCACAGAGGDVLLKNARPEDVETVCACLKEMGCGIVTGRDSIRIRSSGVLTACRPVITRPYPGFPTDAQALLMAACLRARGTSVFVENIFENRYRHAHELRRLGADIRVEGRVAMVTGVSALRGAPVTAGDLRGGAALLLAGLAAGGETRISDSGHLERGYDDPAGTLRALGADVVREDGEQAEPGIEN